MIGILFLVIATLGLLAALGTVLARNLVHAALYLVAFFFLIACVFVMLEAEFMAAIQVLVYIGAVAILLMFGIMLTRNIQGDETTGGTWTRYIPGGLVSLGMLAVLTIGIRDETGGAGRLAWTAMRERPPIARLDAPASEIDTDPRSLAINNMAPAVGREMMTRYVVPFEVAGLLLTAAVVGAIAVAGLNREEEETPRAGAIAKAHSGPANGNGSDGGADMTPPAEDVSTHAAGAAR